MIMQVFSSLLKSECLSFSSILFKSVAKTYKKTAKAKNIVEFIRQAVGQHILSHIDSESKENSSNLDKILEKQTKVCNYLHSFGKTLLNFNTFYLRLLRLSEIKKVSNG